MGMAQSPQSDGECCQFVVTRTSASDPESMPRQRDSPARCRSVGCLARPLRTFARGEDSTHTLRVISNHLRDALRSSGYQGYAQSAYPSPSATLSGAHTPECPPIVGEHSPAAADYVGLTPGVSIWLTPLRRRQGCAKLAHPCRERTSHQGRRLRGVSTVWTPPTSGRRSMGSAMPTSSGPCPPSRHRAATVVYRGTGYDLRLTQVFLGHSSPAVNAIYVHVEREDLQRASATARLSSADS
jgi:hypothetical protein